MEYNQLTSVSEKVSINSPKITAYSNTRMFIENFKGVVYYSKTKIEINTHDFLITITGEDLVIKYMTKDELEIDGGLLTVNFDK